MSCDCCRSGLSSLIIGASRAFRSPILRVSWCTSPDISSRVAPFLQRRFIRFIRFIGSFPLVESGLLLRDPFQVLRGISEARHPPVLLQRCQALLQTCLPAPQHLSTRYNQIHTWPGSSTSQVRARTPDSARSSDNSARFSLYTVDFVLRAFTYLTEESNNKWRAKVWPLSV